MTLISQSVEAYGAFSMQQKAVQRSRARVLILLIDDNAEVARFMKEMSSSREGTLFLTCDVTSDTNQLCSLDPEMASDASLCQRVLRGLFVMNPLGQNENSPLYQAYVARRQHLPPTAGKDGLCHPPHESDDDGTPLWVKDHDDNASTPLACANFDLSKDGHYDGFGYDAVFAVAHALHELIEVQQRPQIVGSELLGALLTRVRFEGVTGMISFDDPTYQGDRRVGLRYSFLNLADITQGLVEVGRWSPCASTNQCQLVDRWSSNGQPFTYPTPNNTRPPGMWSCFYGEILTLDE
eukprot:1612844-Prymnesium_polylepis.1